MRHTVVDMNETCLQECLVMIEKKLGWGSSDNWLNQDFQLLSDRIFEETRVRLSITTLKRIWGKVNYDSAPSISTLNTLALFLGHENWSTFRQKTQTIAGKPKEVPKKPAVGLSKALIVGVLVVLVISTAALLAFSDRNELTPFSDSDLEKVHFSSQPVTLGLPNSVVFNYDFADLDADYTAIQQSWNDQLTFEVDKAGREATGIYYYPGYFRAKLVADGQILKEHDIHIRTDGWMATLGSGEIPRYLYKSEIETDEVLKLSSETFEEVHAMEEKQAPLLSYHFFDDFGKVPGNDFRFETRFRNTYNKSNGICKGVNILIHGKNGVIILPFSIPGCISDLQIFAMGLSISGKTNDLSAFGTDVENWQEVSCLMKDDQVQISLNGQLIKEFTMPADMGDIVGLKYRFEGAGEVDYTRVYGPEGLALSEGF